MRAVAGDSVQVPPVRIAFLTHEPFYPPSGGGSAEAVYLVSEMVRRGHEVHLFCPEITDAPQVEKQFGIKLHSFRRWKMGRYASLRNLKYLLYPSALAGMVRRDLSAAQQLHGKHWRFDTLLAQHTISAVAAGRLRRQLGVPVVFNYLDFLTGFMETWPAAFTRSGLVPALNRYELNLPRRYDVEGVMTVSQPLADRLAATGYPRSRLLAIQYGYDADLFSPAPMGSASSNRPTVVMHGSFDKHHLGPIARGAIGTVVERRPETIFRFIGHETEGLRRFVADVHNTRPQTKIELSGFVPYGEVASLLRSATVGIVPYEESRGTHCAFVAKAVEYLGCGLPVVSTPLENLRSYFHGEAAIRFSQFTGESFGEAILDWINTDASERCRIGALASQRVARELDWKIIAGKAVDFVEERQRAGSGKAPVAV